MSNLKSTYTASYEKRNPHHYNDKGYRALIIGLAIGTLIGSAGTAFLLTSYTLIFK